MIERSQFESRYDKECSLLRVVQTDSVPLPAFYPLDIGVSFHWINPPGREANYFV
jgi:hypothetical protein